jgi:hypothetical protein
MIEKIISELRPLVKIEITPDNILQNLQTGIVDLTANQIRKEVHTKLVMDLKADPTLNHKFDTDKLKDTQWGILVKYVVNARADELKSVKIVRRGKKYDISELKKSYWGKLILKDIITQKRRKTLNQKEYDEIKLACRRINLVLPEVIMPTTTEKFFEEFEGVNIDE